MKTVIVIPARLRSTRFPAKALTPIKGASGEEKSLIERSYLAAKAVKNADDVVVATDHISIANLVEGFGGKVVMTSEDCPNGTARVAEVAGEIDADLFVNFQGDAPLTPPSFVEGLIDYMEATGAKVATPVLPASHEMLEALRQDRKNGLVGGTTAVFDGRNRALYFSKEVLPISDTLVSRPIDQPTGVYLHLGLYAYRREVLTEYVSLAEGRLEAIEALEQLRFLEHGIDIDCVEFEAKGREFWEVNNPEDVARVEAEFLRRGRD